MIWWDNLCLTTNLIAAKKGVSFGIVTNADCLINVLCWQKIHGYSNIGQFIPNVFQSNLWIHMVRHSKFCDIRLSPVIVRRTSHYSYNLFRHHLQIRTTLNLILQYLFDADVLSWFLFCFDFVFEIMLSLKVDVEGVRFHCRYIRKNSFKRCTYRERWISSGWSPLSLPLRHLL